MNPKPLDPHTPPPSDAGGELTAGSTPAEGAQLSCKVTAAGAGKKYGTGPNGGHKKGKGATFPLPEAEAKKAEGLGWVEIIGL